MADTPRPRTFLAVADDDDARAAILGAAYDASTRAEVATLLGVDPKTLYRHVRRLGLADALADALVQNTPAARYAAHEAPAASAHTAATGGE